MSRDKPNTKRAIQRLKKKKPVSLVVQKTAQMIGDAVTEMDGLSGLSVKMLHYFLQHEMKLPKYEIAIDPKELLIIISPQLPDGKPVFMKSNDDTLFDRLSEKIGIPDWSIRFAKRTDYEKAAGDEEQNC